MPIVDELNEMALNMMLADGSVTAILPANSIEILMSAAAQLASKDAEILAHQTAESQLAQALRELREECREFCTWVREYYSEHRQLDGRAYALLVKLGEPE